MASISGCRRSSGLLDGCCSLMTLVYHLEIAGVPMLVSSLAK